MGVLSISQSRPNKSIDTAALEMIPTLDLFPWLKSRHAKGLEAALAVEGAAAPPGEAG